MVGHPSEAVAAGLAAEQLESLQNDYDDIKALWIDTRVPELQSQYEQELVDILGFDLNEFLKVSSQLKTRQIFYVD